MKKVIIADDNRMVMESVFQLIPWEQHGFSVSAKAFDGMQALAAIKEFGADLLVTDIKMPFMDGLQLIREVRGLGLDTKAVVLSSYNDFDLVREAMRLGASEYILKTELDPASFVVLMRTLAGQLDKERQDSERLQKQGGLSEADLNRLKEADHELFRNRMHIKGQLLSSFCLGYVSEEHFLAKKKVYLDIRYEQGLHAMLYLSADNFQKLLKLRWNGKEQLLAFAAANVMEEILASEGKADLFYNGSGEFVVLLNVKEAETGSDPSRWSRLFATVASSLEHYFHLSISGGFSIKRSVNDSVPKLYVQAMQACQFRFIHGKGHLFFYEDTLLVEKKHAVTAVHQSYERVELLRNALNVFHPQLLLKTAESLFVKSDDVTPDNFREALRLFEKYSFVLTDFVEKNGLKNTCGNLLESFNEFVYDQEAIPDLNRRLQEIMERIADGIASGNSHVRQLIKYIQGHYKEEIALQSAAEQLGVSSAYLGRLVQKELGVNFSEYLNQYRIERAKELLSEGLFKIYEIAEAVGYGSTEHFSRMFKKVTGFSPKEFTTGKAR